jgi:hypothetical protein
MVQWVVARSAGPGLSLLAALGLVGCAGEACPGLADGSYVAHFERRSGTCNPSFDQVLVKDMPTVFVGDPDCDLHSGGADACGEDFDMDCDEYNDLDQQIGSSSWAGSIDYDGNSASGVISVEYDTTEVTCFGTYDVTFEPL